MEVHEAAKNARKYRFLFLPVSERTQAYPDILFEKEERSYLISLLFLIFF